MSQFRLQKSLSFHLWSSFIRIPKHGIIPCSKFIFLSKITRDATIQPRSPFPVPSLHIPTYFQLFSYLRLSTTPGISCMSEFCFCALVQNTNICSFCMVLPIFFSKMILVVRNKISVQISSCKTRDLLVHVTVKESNSIHQISSGLLLCFFHSSYHPFPCTSNSQRLSLPHVRLASFDYEIPRDTMTGLPLVTYLIPGQSL